LNKYMSFIKGSPEKIKEMSNKDALPQNYDEICQIYTQSGFRVISLAFKPLDINFG